MDVWDSLFVERWPFWAGGAAIGLFTVGLHALLGKPLGVMTGLAEACSIVPAIGPRERSEQRWRLCFVAGIALGGLAAGLLGGHLAPRLTMGSFEALGLGGPLKAGVFVGGGALLGFGARLAGGCTSGHGILGVSLLSRSSLVAMGSFMASGALVANLLYR